MAEEVRIRVANADDDPERLFDLLWALAPEDDRPEPGRLRSVWRAVVAQEGRRVFLAEAGAHLVGSIDTIVVPNLTRGAQPFMLVENMVVESAARRRGVGSALLDTAFSWARECGCYKVQLLSNAKREEAHSFYEGHGFAQSARGYRRYL
ncbi:GNAT family N-acetyltransferase [Saccharothrix variisporea]|uniref:Ribosomal protein S18 acetylase RimI-like enzyme n=1 Tax=Saccharothrix variisporea TaxID=543527 RepID=A0A495X4S3_9PSEU|nr:GNAT family N-acetyltransferase [Saccharothrix variisporea]RKT69301.1 ribosomal protein S18 acetylase RimI-like enzyme [Saccharothrix variisporea]